MKRLHAMFAGALLCAAAGCAAKVPNPDYIPPDLSGGSGDGMPDLAKTDFTIPDLSSCRGAADCADPKKPVCGMDGTCRACADKGDDAACLLRSAQAPRCDPMSGTCVACRADTQAADCAQPTAPICDAAMCRGCKAHAECAASLVCNPDGSCATPSDVLYVDNANGACNGMHTGTKMDPYCQVTDALTNLGMKKLIHVAGSTAPYGAIAITAMNADVTVSLIGFGKSAMPTAKLRTDGAAAALLQAQGKALNVTIDGLELDGAGMNGENGVNCIAAAGTATVAITNSLIQKSPGAGVSATKCTVTVTQSIITGNTGGGLALTSGTYQIVNNFIVDNGNNGIAVTLDTTSKGTFSFNTVSGNQNGSALASFDCGNGMPKMIESSVVVKNTNDGATQFAGKCTLSNVVTGPDSAMNASMLLPTFVQWPMLPHDYHLKAGDAMNRACCVDKVKQPDGGMLMLPGVDIDNSKRPKGAGWDLGAHEVE